MNYRSGRAVSQLAVRSALRKKTSFLLALAFGHCCPSLSRVAALLCGGFAACPLQKKGAEFGPKDNEFILKGEDLWGRRELALSISGFQIAKGRKI
ncbi:hypothetical protein SGRA_3535 [Saprospira grandis str. Lewin]|uniref:Uncharacterized protein n=1 Tax=Saprospira grandis (strain Lewin) TaxID=984262 RepID=H6L095_SAPGL|nr:hypothetical protein SGRA_3535 [Saprospira grandis str. Lewin]